MKKYMVTKSFSGSITYEVEADDEQEAEEIASDLLADESNESIVENLELDGLTSIEEIEE